MRKWKRTISIGMVAALLAGAVPASAESAGTEVSMADNSTGTEVSIAAGAEETEKPEPLKSVRKISEDEIKAMNGGADVTVWQERDALFVDGPCTEQAILGEADALAVAKSVMNLAGEDERMEFVPDRTITDPDGNRYYIFQQIYKDTLVWGGAVKVITDADGKMLGLNCSVESALPETDTEEGITAAQAEEAVRKHMRKTENVSVRVLPEYTSLTILPVNLKYDIESEDETVHFVWTVYTDHPSGAEDSAELPFLAHYVSMNGEYLYQMPAIVPGDDAGKAGYDASYVFEFMESVPYTGYVDLSDGSEMEVSVDVMRDRRTGMYYLGNLERRIVVADCYEFLYNDNQVVMEYSPDNLEWDQVGLLSLYNYCRAYDYYKEIGWLGGDGAETPILILNNFCDGRHKEVNNACYAGKVHGFQCFVASKINDLSQCLDVLAHEFTHCVTGTVMTYNSYMNDYGAINEAMSDIQGKICDMMADDGKRDNWILGADSMTPVRSMSDPHDFQQPEYTWDLYYHPAVSTPTAVNDYGGVHTNSSLLNQIAYMLIDKGGMKLEEARKFWFMVDCAMVPKTDYVQLGTLLPWVLRMADMTQYGQTLENAIQAVRLLEKQMPEHFDEDRALLKVSLPATEAFDTNNWVMYIYSLDTDLLKERLMKVVEGVLAGDYSCLPPFMEELINGDLDKRVEMALPILEAAITLMGGYNEMMGTDSDWGQADDGSQEDSGEQDALFPWMDEDPADASDEMSEEAGRILEEIETWLSELFEDVLFIGNGSAGQDGQTVNMVVRPGRTIPVLMHAVFKDVSDTPDQVAVAVYVAGKWFDLTQLAADAVAEDASQKLEEFSEEDFLAIFAGTDVEPMLADLMAGKYDNFSLDGILDLLTVEIKPGTIKELDSDGLETVVIPPPSEEEAEIEYEIVPGRKSRPKTEEKELQETEAQTEMAA